MGEFDLANNIANRLCPEIFCYPIFIHCFNFMLTSVPKLKCRYQEMYLGPGANENLKMSNIKKISLSKSSSPLKTKIKLTFENKRHFCFWIGQFHMRYKGSFV